ncbi:hypothetical protein KLP40_06465 [Hymenobacter sp. NST-14]|uniref:hypothetical protein n=1 Tax=Hymenobacter piscis TaxID=2839984 RepID=UPI001C0112F1|nr:hypothetical protein [Hymenobacter piscis]MBT9392801.1 hypothetical protein [Hymenobacter piscis]
MLTLPTLRLAALLAFTGLGAAACISPPDYPDTPEIEFKSITQQPRTNPLGGIENNVGITVSYRDGDGNLGMKEDEIRQAGNAPQSPNSYNYICTLQIRDGSNTFIDYNFTPIFPGYSGQFPYLPPAEQGDRAAPIRGDLTLNVVVTATPPVLPRGSVVRFKIKIKDRDLNESNEVLTSPITLQ